MAELNPSVQCSDDLGQPAPFQTGREVAMDTGAAGDSPSGSGQLPRGNPPPRPQAGIEGAAGDSRLGSEQLQTDAERVPQNTAPHSNPQLPGMHRPAQHPAPDRIEIPGAHGSIVATGLAANMQGGTLQIGHTNNMTVYKKGSSSASDKGDRKSNIKNKYTITGSKAVPEVRHLDVISAALAKDWRRLGRALGLTDAALDQIHMDYASEGVHEVNYRVLLRWKQQSENPTLNKLALTLADIGRGDLADELSKEP